MSILIKGMEMPTTCGNCPVHKLWAEDDEAQCMIKRELWTKYSERNPDCPLVEVPPHGRLIDADALIERMFDQLVAKTMMFGGQYVYTKEEINNAPTVIPSDKDGET